MIEINLIPSSLRKKSSNQMFANFPVDVPRQVSLIAMGCVLILVFVHVLLLGFMLVKGAVLSVRQIEWQQVSPDKKKLDALYGEADNLKKKTSGLSEVMPSRYLDWSRKLNIISDAMTKGLWLKKIVLEKAKLEKGKTSKEKTETVKPEKGKVDKAQKPKVELEKYSLTIEGSVISKTQGEIAAVGMFVSALKKDEFFMRDLVSLQVNSVEHHKNGTTDVADFVVTAKLK